MIPTRKKKTLCNAQVLLDVLVVSAYNHHLANEIGNEMNERILELAKQAGLKFPSETAMSPVELKFAELIVRECAEVVYSRSGHANPQDLYEHFGVEE